MALKVIWKARTALKPYPNNPRNNDKAVDAVAESLAEFGWQQPIVVDENLVVIAGHTRLKAAEKLGLEKVPVAIAEGLTPEQVKAYRLADNKTAEIAGWDFNLLNTELAELSEEFDMERFGFFVPSADDFGEDFSLPDGDKESTVYNFTFHREQWDRIRMAIEDLAEDPEDQRGRGAAIYLICAEVNP